MQNLNLEIPSDQNATEASLLCAEALNAKVSRQQGILTITPDGSIMQTLKGIIEATTPNQVDNSLSAINRVLNVLDEVDDKVWQENLSIQAAKENFIEVITNEMGVSHE